MSGGYVYVYIICACSFFVRIALVSFGLLAVSLKLLPHWSSEHVCQTNFWEVAHVITHVLVFNEIHPLLCPAPGFVEAVV